MNKSIHELNQDLKETQALLSQEIARRRAAEEALRISRQTFKVALKEMPVIILAMDADGGLVFFNREFERISGYNARDLAEDPALLQMLFPDGEEPREDKSGFHGEWCFRSKDGSEKVVFWSNISEYFPILGWKSWKIGVNITELKDAQAKIRVLSGLLPICASCKKIRDDKGYWNRIEAYIQDHSEAAFSHGICPSCAKKLYPELYEEGNE